MARRFGSALSSSLHLLVPGLPATLDLDMIVVDPIRWVDTGVHAKSRACITKQMQNMPMEQLSQLTQFTLADKNYQSKRKRSWP